MAFVYMHVFDMYLSLVWIYICLIVCCLLPGKDWFFTLRFACKPPGKGTVDGNPLYTAHVHGCETERPSRIALFRRRAFFLLSLGAGGGESSRVPLTPFRYPFTRSVAEPLKCVADPRLTSPLLPVRMWWRAFCHAWPAASPACCPSLVTGHDRSGWGPARWKRVGRRRALY